MLEDKDIITGASLRLSNLMSRNNVSLGRKQEPTSHSKSPRNIID